MAKKGKLFFAALTILPTELRKGNGGKVTPYA